MVIDKVKLLLGTTNTLTDDQINAVIYVSSDRYMRFRPLTPDNWGSNQRAKSWITEYATAYCRFMIEMDAESPNLSTLVQMIQSLEDELQKFA